MSKDFTYLQKIYKYIVDNDGVVSIFWITKTQRRARAIARLEQDGFIKRLKEDGRDTYPICVFEINEKKKDALLYTLDDAVGMFTIYPMVSSNEDACACCNGGRHIYSISDMPNISDFIQDYCRGLAITHRKSRLIEITIRDVGESPITRLIDTVFRATAIGKVAKVFISRQFWADTMENIDTYNSEPSEKRENRFMGFAVELYDAQDDVPPDFYIEFYEDPTDIGEGQ